MAEGSAGWLANKIVNKLKIQKHSIWLALPLMTLMWVGSAGAVSVDGTTVTAGGSTIFAGLPLNGGKIEYFIPLASGATGTYGETGGLCGSAPEGVGTCADYGSGQGYETAGALDMNIFFDLTGVADSATAQLNFVFDDLDLRDVNDPNYFYESMSLSYWDGSVLNSIGGVYETTAELEAQGSVTIGGKDDPIEWSLDLGAGGLNLLSLLNSTDDGFWIQLGFGSKYCKTKTSRSGQGTYERCYNGLNTEEFLTATLNVSPVPLPSAVWLFGSALIGFIGMSRRTRV